MVNTRYLPDSTSLPIALQEQVFDVLNNKTDNTKGAGAIGYRADLNYPVGSIGAAIPDNLPSTPQDFAYLVPGGVVPSGVDDTAAFVALAVRYNTVGGAVHFPDTGTPYLIQPDQVIFKPPSSYNLDNRRAPFISMDKSAIIRAKAGGSFLIQIGTIDNDYSGYIRSADFDLGIIDGYNFAFSKAPLYMPFYFDIRLNVTVSNGKRLFWSGDTSAPGPSAGLKGRRDYDRQLPLWRRDSLSITNATNPVVTFGTPHGLWPSSGSRCMSINFSGSYPVGWNAIAGKSLDVVILSSTTVQLLNVNSTGFGAFTGLASCYLNMISMRVPKRITGVTNANPCVVTTAIPHLLTSGDTVDLAEIGGMSPDAVYNPGTYTGLQGQFVVTVTSATTFSLNSINTTSTSIYGAYNAGLGPGWAMQWVPIDQCDISEYHDNATDIDDSELFVKHSRVGVYHNPATCGWDGKKSQPHFYSFPESGEILACYYLGGDNNCVQVQADGPFRYVFWAFGPRNASSHTSTNVGYIDPRDQYGCLVRTEPGAGWNSRLDRMKGRPSFRMMTDHSGPGSFTCNDNIYSDVYAPFIEFGPGKRVGSVRFVGSSGAIQTATYINSVTRTGAGTYTVSFVRPLPAGALVLATAGSSGLYASEDETARTSFSLKLIVQDASGGLQDAAHVSLNCIYM